MHAFTDWVVGISVALIVAGILFGMLSGRRREQSEKSEREKGIAALASSRFIAPVFLLLPDEVRMSLGDGNSKRDPLKEFAALLYDLAERLGTPAADHLLCMSEQSSPGAYLRNMEIQAAAIAEDDDSSVKLAEPHGPEEGELRG